MQEVFYNLDAILEQHERMLGALLQKQREYHPLIDSVAEIIMKRALLSLPSTTLHFFLILRSQMLYSSNHHMKPILNTIRSRRRDTAPSYGATRGINTSSSSVCTTHVSGNATSSRSSHVR